MNNSRVAMECVIFVYNVEKHQAVNEPSTQLANQPTNPLASVRLHAMMTLLNEPLLCIRQLLKRRSPLSTICLMHDAGNMQNKTTRYRYSQQRPCMQEKCDAPGTQCQLEGSIAHVLLPAAAPAVFNNMHHCFLSQSFH
jgi:hypothetical protein